jgi:1-acyl-sn-glycerol-3-phosphate acyltransferase
MSEQSFSYVVSLFVLIVAYYILSLCYNLYEAMMFNIVGKISIPDQAVICFYPHTSYFDAIAVAMILRRHNIDALPLVKQIHRIPARLAMYVCGDFEAKMVEIPTDSGTNETNTSMNISELVKSETDKTCRILLSPEGTRSFAPNITSGFIGIARQLNWPIVFLSLDYRTRTAICSKPVQADNFKQVMDQFRLCCSKSFGKYPDSASPILLKMEEYAI